MSAKWALCSVEGEGAGPDTLLAGVEGDAHTIPLTMAADTLTAGGFEVIHLGANLPAAELVAALRARR